MITSNQNSKIQLVRTLLARPSARAAQKLIVVEGVRLVEEALRCGWQAVFALYTDRLSPRGMQSVEALRARNVPVDQVAAFILDMISDTENSQGLLVVFHQRSLPVPEEVNFLLVADAVRDPGNMGTLLRTAWAAGVQGVLLAPGCVDAYAPKVLRAGMGAQFHLPVQRLIWDEIADYREKVEFFLAEMEQAVSCWQANLRVPLALIIGGEAEGACAQARALAHTNLVIPMPGKSESLNAAVAASILIFEVVRQRRTEA